MMNKFRGRIVQGDYIIGNIFQKNRWKEKERKKGD